MRSLAMCGFSFLLLIGSSHAAPFDNQLASQIDTYLASKNSPLAGNGSAFVASGLSYNVDPRLIVAIAGAESSFATDWAACSSDGFNAWSWFYNGSCPNSTFTSFAQGIDKVTSGIRRLYLNKNLTTISQIRAKYCIEGCGGWVPNVTQVYTDLGGDLTDLTYQQPPALAGVLQPGPGVGKDIWTTSFYSYANCAGPGTGGGRYDEQLRVGGWGDTYQSLIQFDLTGMPSHANSATLYLYCYSYNDGSGTPLFLDRITQLWWNWQTTGTGCDHERLWWADKPNTVQWGPVLPTPAMGQWYTIDITELYNGWQSGQFPNYGLQLRPAQTSDTFDLFYSSRYADDMLRPKLVVQ